MSFAEKLIKERAVRTPQNYARRVAWLAAIYLILNLVSIFIIAAIIWRGQFFVTLSQRSNIETLTLAIILVLASYYVLTTFRGFIGALRLIALNAPRLGIRDPKLSVAVERRKHKAIRSSNESKYACFDKAIRRKDNPDQPVEWKVGDEAGQLGLLSIEGAKATYRPIKDGLNDSFFEFVADQIENVLKKHEPEISLNIVQWSTIDEDQAAAYNSMVEAFTNLERQLGSKGALWPTLELTQVEVDEVGNALRELVPTLRNEAMLPDVEYEVEYSVPIIPEPLGFMRLTRRDNRADPVISMGCVGIVMLFIMLLLTFIIILPPWVPSS